MKKFLSLVLVVLLLAMCTACGGNEDTPSNTDPQNSGTTSSNNNSTTEPNNQNDKPKTITFADVNNAPTSPATDFFCNDDGNGGLIILEYLGDDEIVVIPEEINGKAVTKINKFVFANDSSVMGVKLSSTIKEIDEGAFTQNTKLQYVICGNGLETIGASAFFGCSSLCEIKLNEGLKTICKQSFTSCEALKSIEIPASVGTIELVAFNMMADDFKIIGVAGSVAETYAKESSFNFEAK